jgi:hypothetical protein
MHDRFSALQSHKTVGQTSIEAIASSTPAHREHLSTQARLTPACTCETSRRSSQHAHTPTKQTTFGHIDRESLHVRLSSGAQSTRQQWRAATTSFKRTRNATPTHKPKKQTSNHSERHKIQSLCAFLLTLPFASCLDWCC